eukprot:1074310-Amphidinium_carterae.1
MQFHVPHATVERYARRLRSHITNYIEAQQEHIEIGAGVLEEWEVDECTISHFDSHRTDRPKGWVGYIGLIKRVHTDSAGAYQTKLARVHHTKVVHQKKKVGRHWIRPTFVKRVRLTIKKRKLTFLAGTQTIDGVWQKIRDETQHRVGGKTKDVDGLVRLAQFKY